MSRSPRTIALRAEGARAAVLPHEGGVASELTVGGVSVLARTPWADHVSAHEHPAGDEATWVRRWRGGWQLCFPTAGRPEPGAFPPQAFHGTASQAAWTVVEESADRVSLAWSDEQGISARRDWMLRPDGLDVTTRARYDGEAARDVIIAEHLILGGDIIAPALEGRGLRLEASPDSMIASLDYDGSPAGGSTRWPGDPDAPWDRIDATVPARVAALIAPEPIVVVTGPAWTATVTWRGLAHALLWEELARSREEPWNGEVVALGIEPTSTPHGAGTGDRHGGAVPLTPGESLTWSVSLRITSTGPLGPKEEDG